MRQARRCRPININGGLKPAWLLIAALSLSLVRCGAGPSFSKPETLPDDRRRIAKPPADEINIIDDIFDKQSRKMQNSFNLARQLRLLFNRPKQAMNVDAYDEVPDSSWFTNRNARKPMTLEEIVLGANTSTGPDTSNPWTIFRVKDEGVTVGFDIEDSLGIKYVIKFEPIGFSEMCSGAEIVCSKLFHAAGYNVPENHIIYFDPQILELGDNIRFTDSKGKRRVLTRDDLDDILSRVEYEADGRIRVTASKYLTDNPENLLGPFKYVDCRKDDPNDFIPHEHRRELRGLRVMAAWLNHFDTKANNTINVFTDEGYIKHYLIDFGSTLGSNGDEPMPPYIGFDTSFGPKQIVVNTATLGLNVKPWEKPVEIKYPSIGHFVSTYFHPQKYKFILPNPAFENMTDRDGYWGAKLVMSFTDEQIEAVVEEGRYSDPEAAAYLVRTILERRDITGRYWFDRMPPLDRFKIRNDTGDNKGLAFSDLGVEAGLFDGPKTQYRYEARFPDGRYTAGGLSAESLWIPLKTESFTSHIMADPAEITIRLKRAGHQNWSRWVKVYVEYNRDTERFELLGLLRQE